MPVDGAGEGAIAELADALGDPGLFAVLLDAAKETKPSTIEWLETARSYATYANRAGLYDELVAFFDK